MIVILLSLFSIMALCAFADDYKDDPALLAVETRLRGSIDEFGAILGLNHASLDFVAVYDNYETAMARDYVAAVNMIYDHRVEPSDDAAQIKSISALVAMLASEACPEIVEMTVFWNLTEYDGSAWIDFELNHGDYHYRGVTLPDEMN